MTTYDVGGYELDRPFKIRRFGHLGLNVEDFDETVRFYCDLLGFRVTDLLHLFDYLDGRALEVAQSVVTDDRMAFTGYAGDHHSLLVAHTTFGTFNRNDRNYPDNTLSQLSWQVATLEEIVEADAFLQERGARIVRVGRDMPGGNWHVYFLDPDGNTVELFYGMEQIGWSRVSRPTEMHSGASLGVPDLPIESELAELYAAQDAGIDVDAGSRPQERHLAETHDVGGVRLARPFKIVELGPIGMYTERFDEMVAFYTETLGLKVTETAEIDGHRVVHLRHGHEHHSLTLADKALRSVLGTNPATSNLFVGMRLGSYRQLRAAVAYLVDHGAEHVSLPDSLSLGQGYTTYVADPAGHLVQLSCEMEQIGWDGRPRPASERRPLATPWPATLDGAAGTYDEPAYWGGLG